MPGCSVAMSSQMQVSGLFPYLPQLQQLPVIIDVTHQVHLRVKVLLLVDHTQVVQAQVCHIPPETFQLKTLLSLLQQNIIKRKVLQDAEIIRVGKTDR